MRRSYNREPECNKLSPIDLSSCRQIACSIVTMNRRTFVRSVAGTAVVATWPEILIRPAGARPADVASRIDKSSFRKLADIALGTAKKMGAGYADIRVCRYQHQAINTREERVEGIDESIDSGFGVRVLVDEIGRAHV